MIQQALPDAEDHTGGPRPSGSAGVRSLAQIPPLGGTLLPQRPGRHGHEVRSVDGPIQPFLAAPSLAALVDDGGSRRLPAWLVAMPVILGGLNGLIVVLLFFCLWHASVALGTRLTLTFLAITTVTSWIFEEVGVVTGLIFGPYHYTSTLGPWLGAVPILIPMAWFVLVYPSYVVANLIVGGWPVGTPGGRGHLVGRALVGALVLTAWDLVVDPILSGPTVGAWVWERGGPYFGVPVQNYLGWIVTAFTVYLLYRSVERRSKPRQIG